MGFTLVTDNSADIISRVASISERIIIIEPKVPKITII